MNSKGKKKGNQMTVVPEQGLYQVMYEAFQEGSRSDQKLTSNMLKMSSMLASEEQKKQSNDKRSGLSRIAVAMNNAPEILTFSSQTEESKKHKKPKNIASGVGYGGLAFAKGIVYGITGLVT